MKSIKHDIEVLCIPIKNITLIQIQEGKISCFFVAALGKSAFGDMKLDGRRDHIQAVLDFRTL